MLFLIKIETETFIRKEKLDIREARVLWRKWVNKDVKFFEDEKHEVQEFENLYKSALRLESFKV